MSTIVNLQIEIAKKMYSNMTETNKRYNTEVTRKTFINKYLVASWPKYTFSFCLQAKRSSGQANNIKE